MNLFAQCSGLILPPPINREVLAHFLDGWMKDMAIEMLNPFVEGKFVSTSQVERVQIYTLPTYNKVLIDPQIIALEPFDGFHFSKDWI